MNVGMLWFDNDPRTTVLEKIDRAVVYYRSKYGYIPDICFVNPSMLNETPLLNPKVEVKPLPVIQPWNFWLVRKDS
jgi:hypothetical protein